MAFMSSYKWMVDEPNNLEAMKAHHDIVETCIDSNLLEAICDIRDSLQENLTND